MTFNFLTAMPVYCLRPREVCEGRGGDGLRTFGGTNFAGTVNYSAS